MEGSMEKTNKMLAFLHPILEEADPELEDFLIRYVLYWKTFTFLASAFFSLFVVIEPWLNVLSFRNWSMYIQYMSVYDTLILFWLDLWKLYLTSMHGKIHL